MKDVLVINLLHHNLLIKKSECKTNYVLKKKQKKMLILKTETAVLMPITATVIYICTCFADAIQNLAPTRTSPSFSSALLPLVNLTIMDLLQFQLIRLFLVPHFNCFLNVIYSKVFLSPSLTLIHTF